MSFALSSGNYLQRSVGVPASHQDFAACGWLKRGADPEASAYVLHFGTGTNPIQVYIHSSGYLYARFQHSMSRYIIGPAVAVGGVIFFALSCSGTTGTLYWRAEGETSLASGSANNTGSKWTTNNIYLGRDANIAPSNPFTGLVACLRIWDSARSVAELLAESLSLTAVETTDLLSDHRGDGANIAAAIEDDHSSNNDFTAVGSPTVDAWEPTVTVSGGGGGSSISASGSANWPVITTVDLVAAPASMIEGDTLDRVVTVKNQSAAGLQYLTGTVTSSDTDVCTVAQVAATDASGQATVRITAVAAGTATVTATFDGVQSNELPITVETQPSQRPIVVEPDGATVRTTETVQYAATFDDGSEAAVTWSVSSGAGSIDGTGLYTAPAVGGTATIRATLTADATIYDDTTVTINAPTAYATLSPVYRSAGSPIANLTLDYWVADSSDEIIANGSGTTDADGVLTIQIPAAYAGATFCVMANNLGTDMSTAGKVQHQQVVVAV